MTKVLGLACLILLALSAEAAARCLMPLVRTPSGQTSTGYMTADSGKPCTIRFTSAGPTYSTVISQQPSHGTLRVGDIGHVIYASRAGYVGSDAFTYVRSGRGARGGHSVRTVHVAVTVTP
jgi:Bacterial Ig domain